VSEKSSVPRIIGAVSFMLIILLSSFTVFAQTDTTRAAGVSPSMPHGDWALQIALGNPLSSDNFRQYDVLVKRHYSPNTAIRLSANFGANVYSNSNNNSVNFNDSTSFYTAKMNGNRQGLNLTALYLKYFTNDNHLGVFWGVGPTAGFSRDKDKRNSQSKEGQSQIATTNYWYLSAGLSAALGAEFFVLKRLSITAEYGVSMVYSRGWRKTTSENPGYTPTLTSTSKVVSNQFGVNLSSINFGLSVYF
jgi:hypothetical protein